MAHNVVVRLVDDLDGGPADDTVAFALDGCGYENDLSAANAEKLREVLRPYAAAGRRATGTRPGAADGTSPRDSRIAPDTARIRAWARDIGHHVASRGRVHQHLREAYYAAHRPHA
ncbi:Lsr2 family protein [Kocuria arenosa]|uniref:histone-like nucleoid-structuring protein Lsr2 n=1 Tax=Kocuria arenosa TaxID=3071446 RepID=UPI0034D66984